MRGVRCGLLNVSALWFDFDWLVENLRKEIVMLLVSVFGWMEQMRWPTNVVLKRMCFIKLRSFFSSFYFRMCLHQVKIDERNKNESVNHSCGDSYCYL